MAVPGPDFLQHAAELGDEATSLRKQQVDDGRGRKKSVEVLDGVGGILEGLVRRALREPGFQLPLRMKGGVVQPVKLIPGHIWGQHAVAWRDGGVDRAPRVDGPHRADVMVIGKMPGSEEEVQLRNFVGPSGTVLQQAFGDLNIRGTSRWYVTNLYKYRLPGGAAPRAVDRRNCRMLLDQELRIVRPKYILCLGADASKELLGDGGSVTAMEGRVAEFEYVSDPEGRETVTALVMTVLHPVNVAKNESLLRTLQRGLARFDMLRRGIRFDKEEQDVDHRRVDDLETLRALLDEIEHDPEKTDDMLAVDAEWHGEHPVNAGGYLRTIQFAWRPKHAAAVVLTGVGGKPAFSLEPGGRPSPRAAKSALDLLRKFFLGDRRYRRKRVCGHFFNSDLEWLQHAGLDLQPLFRVELYDADVSELPPAIGARHRQNGFDDVVPAWARTRYEGGADTGYMAHAVEETAAYGLESLAMRYTTAPRYDLPLDEWRKNFCKEHDLKAAHLLGYGMCPDGILVPYGIYDADVTLRLYYELDSLLDRDYRGNCCREAFWETMIAAPVILRMHTTGICVDRGRIDELTGSFVAARKVLEAQIRKWAGWDDFNIRSVQHVREFLFGDRFNGRWTDEGVTERIRPVQARSLELSPLVDTSKPPVPWQRVVDDGLVQQRNPSTNKTTLGILLHEAGESAEQIGWIRDYRFVDQALKSVLRPPLTDDEGEPFFEEVGDRSYMVYDAGLASVICDDGRVRTHIYPTKETGRWSSARPNLTNLSKTRDKDYKRILGTLYKHKMRSVLKASPGKVLIEADYVGAELFGMAVMSGDPLMIEHATRNQLPEDDPRFYDIHSNVAVLAFRLDLTPTKKAFEAAGKSYLRNIAKTVIFGIAYGRGARAVAFTAREEGVHIEVEEAQAVIDTIFAMYPRLQPFFQEAEERAGGDGWLQHCYGRYRRFPSAMDQGTLAEFQRQAKNFPIQGMVASAMDRALAYLEDALSPEPECLPLLQIHDAVLVEADYADVEYVAERLLPWAMRRRVPIWPTKLDGRPTGVGPFHFGLKIEVNVHWGEMPEAAWMAERGMPVGLRAFDGYSVEYSKAA